jgi:hypothetical protein
MDFIIFSAILYVGLAATLQHIEQCTEHNIHKLQAALVVVL